MRSDQSIVFSLLRNKYLFVELVTFGRLLKCLWSKKIFFNTIKAHNLNDQFPKKWSECVCTFRDILSGKVEFLTQFNVTKYGKTEIEYIEQMMYAVGSLMLKYIVIHNCPTTYVIIINGRTITSKMDKPWQIWEFITQRLCLRFTWNFQWMFQAWFSVENR